MGKVREINKLLRKDQKLNQEYIELENKSMNERLYGSMKKHYEIEEKMKRIRRQVSIIWEEIEELKPECSTAEKKILQKQNPDSEYWD